MCLSTEEAAARYGPKWVEVGEKVDRLRRELIALVEDPSPLDVEGVIALKRALFRAHQEQAWIEAEVDDPDPDLTPIDQWYPRRR